MRGLENRVCIVTGAGSGIGRGIAERLVAEGSRVSVADINADGVRQTVEALSEAGGDAHGITCDVSDRSAVKYMIVDTARHFGRLDIIFNNAGISEMRSFLDVREADWDRIMRVNGLGVLMCMQEAARQLISQGDGGKIINTASISGRQGRTENPHYCASKFAVIALTQAGARAFAEHGITVNAICPGVVATEIWKPLAQQLLAEGKIERAEQAMEQFVHEIPLQRAASPAEIAAVAVFLASSDADYMTGQAIEVDGGMLML